MPKHVAAQGDGLADASQAGNAEGPAAQRQVAPRGHLQARVVQVLRDQVLGEGQDQCEGVLGDGVLVGAGRDGDGDAQLGGGGDIDRVIADAGPSDDAQLRMAPVRLFAYTAPTRPAPP